MARNSEVSFVIAGVRYRPLAVWSASGHVISGVEVPVRCHARVREGVVVLVAARLGTRCASTGSWAPVRVTRQGDIGVGSGLFSLV
jgi:hypothetical protein